MLKRNSLSLSIHPGASVKTYVDNHFSDGWIGRVCPNTGHPDLQTSLRFTPYQIFTYKGTLRSVHQKMWKHMLHYCVAFWMLKQAYTSWNDVGFHARFADVLRLGEHNHLLPDGVRGGNHTHTDSLLGAFAELWKVTISFVMPVRFSRRPSVCLSIWNESAPSGRIFMKFDIWEFFENLEKIQVWLKFDKNKGYFTWRSMYICDNVSLNFS